ncbi:hypothetical protein FKP32DRAFT_1046212 [Trametes sanguinea]|nr:hypothetical protein FKP32DRAFT_1046212 [Trametes sanguinea]
MWRESWQTGVETPLTEKPVVDSMSSHFVLLTVTAFSLLTVTNGHARPRYHAEAACRAKRI